MIIYTVHEPPHSTGNVEERSEHVAFVREGFTFWGFLFGPFWLLWNRLWLEAIAVAALAAGLYAILIQFGAGEQTAGIVNLLVALIIGFEGNDLIRWRLQRKGYTFISSVAGRDREECEHRFFAAWMPPVAGIGGGRASGPVKGAWQTPHSVGTWPEATA
ncbi:DUF2628 domain-containing protein [Rhodomicrobium lacus]|uniref:DUF2628 domain-containing protein n=1 Tax=Rhodomicrobium lacus TaxID=2498452 RepID=UPI000F8F60C9|nr:DUF2628 domain-containing protein [Rhodomicrobium lacus]